VPRYVPMKDRTVSQEVDAAFEHEVRREKDLLRSVDELPQLRKQTREKTRIALAERSPYGPQSPYGYYMDQAAAALEQADQAAIER